MKNSNFKVLVLPAVILFSVCLVFTFLLAYTNKITEPRIEELAAANAEAARKDLLSDAKSFDAGAAELDGESFEYYKGLDADGKTTGYVFTTVSTGYGGDIKVMTGVDVNGAVKKINILELNETPGLGMNAKDDSFINLFTGKSGVISVVKTKAGENEIQAMTGATITSSAVTSAVNKALKLYDAATGQTEATTEKVMPKVTEKTILNGKEYTYDRLLEDGVTAGYIFSTEAQGYASKIKIRTGIDNKGVITGVEILELNDTEGIGSQVANSSFLSRFIGKSGSVTVVNSNAGENEIQAITGATISSSGVTAAVNLALALYNSVSGGSK
jgi:Na+-translocating ferredoxin:NAD+ oxidoreductase subunit G